MWFVSQIKTMNGMNIPSEVLRISLHQGFYERVPLFNGWYQKKDESKT